jgi:hypothetical protein
MHDTRYLPLCISKQSHTRSVIRAHQVPDSLRRELANVCRACFSGEGVARHGALVAAYRAQFVAELNPEVTPHTECHLWAATYVKASDVRIVMSAR